MLTYICPSCALMLAVLSDVESIPVPVQALMAGLGGPDGLSSSKEGLVKMFALNRNLCIGSDGVESMTTPSEMTGSDFKPAALTA